VESLLDNSRREEIMVIIEIGSEEVSELE